MAQDTNSNSELLDGARTTLEEARFQEAAIDAINNVLRQVYYDLRHSSPQAANGAKLSDVLRLAAEREILIGQKLEYLYTFTRRLTNAQEAFAPEQANRIIVRVSQPRGQAGVNLNIDITHWFARARELADKFGLLIQQAIGSIGKMDHDGAAQQVRAAILTNRMIEDLLERILTLERRLILSAKMKS